MRFEAKAKNRLPISVAHIPCKTEILTFVSIANKASQFLSSLLLKCEAWNCNAMSKLEGRRKPMRTDMNIAAHAIA